MARAGLGESWNCVFANDFDPIKADSYRDNWAPAEELVIRDVNLICAREVPTAELAWASFPCQDLSLAGNSSGIGEEEAATRSGSFWGFWRVIRGLKAEGREPKVLVLENVYGVLTANGGRDFVTIVERLTGEGYSVGALVVDARHFVPQSRPRVFIVGVRGEGPSTLVGDSPSELWHPARLTKVVEQLSSDAKQKWRWWRLPKPQQVPASLSEIVQTDPEHISWDSPAETKRLLAMMSEPNRQKLRHAMSQKAPVVGTFYRRTRIESGNRTQRVELRFDGIAGCLRTPSGGSSRQSLIFVHGRRVRTRLITPREAARLMGLPESFVLPRRYNDAYHMAGDGVVVPVVKFLADELITPAVRFGSSGH